MLKDEIHPHHCWDSNRKSSCIALNFYPAFSFLRITQWCSSWITEMRFLNNGSPNYFLTLDILAVVWWHVVASCLFHTLVCWDCTRSIEKRWRCYQVMPFVDTRIILWYKIQHTMWPCGYRGGRRQYGSTRYCSSEQWYDMPVLL
jgi:hypothetical protein